MKRGEPPKRKTPLKRGKPLRRVSAKTAKRNAQYSVQRRAFLDRRPHCAATELAFTSCTRWATDVHHLRGRIGSLMLDENNWAPMCRSCHAWVTDHPNDNVKLIEHLERQA